MKSDQELLKKSIDILNNLNLNSDESKILKETLARFDKTLQEKTVLENRFEEQSKMAMMGGMIDEVAHQWIQPIGIISLYTKMISDDFKYGDVNQKYLDNLVEKVDIQTEFLLNTLKEFRCFLRPTTDIQVFHISKAIQSSLTILQDSLKGSQISVNTDIDQKRNFEIIGSKIELENLFINLINNSKDAFVEKKIENRKIDINTFQKENSIYCQIQDNAGGISKHILDKVFDLNFTTKEIGKGTGVGLYMVKRIMEKLDGDITVQNIENGVLFNLIFKKAKVD